MNCCRGSKGPTGSKQRKDSQETLEPEMRELFRLFDAENSRSISIQELGRAMRFLGMSPTEEEISNAMAVLDVNGDGRLKFQEFHSFMQAEMSKISVGDYTIKEDDLRSAFKTFDKDGNGFIDASELRTAMATLGECLTDRELEDMMKQADVDGDGKLNYEEFVHIWSEAKST